jgi:hypothetical protein
MTCGGDRAKGGGRCKGSGEFMHWASSYIIDAVLSPKERNFPRLVKVQVDATAADGGSQAGTVLPKLGTSPTATPHGPALT